MATPNASAPLGQGGRFAALQKKLGARPGVTNPGALAAFIGRKKYGAKKFHALAVAGHMPAGGHLKGHWGDVGAWRQKEAAAVGGFKAPVVWTAKSLPARSK